MPHDPGTLPNTAGKLTRAKINVEFVYGTAHKGCENPTIVFGVGDVKKATGLLT